jgi:hypothetical protein
VPRAEAKTLIRITLVRVALAVGIKDPPLITGLHDDEGAVLPFFLRADALRTRPPHPPRPSVADACCADRAEASMTRVDRFERHEVPVWQTSPIGPFGP